MTYVLIDGTTDPGLKASIPDDLHDQIEEEAEELKMSKSATCRYYIQLGRKLGPIYDPRQDAGGSSDAKNLTPFHSRIPEDPEDAITISELVERIDEYIFDICEEDERIEREGREVYLDGD